MSRKSGKPPRRSRSLRNSSEAEFGPNSSAEEDADRESEEMSDTDSSADEDFGALDEKVGLPLAARAPTQPVPPQGEALRENHTPLSSESSHSSSGEEEELVFSIEDDDFATARGEAGSARQASFEAASPLVLNELGSGLRRSDTTTPHPNMPASRGAAQAITITTLPVLPGARVARFLGRVSLHFVREAPTTTYYEGGISGLGGAGGAGNQGSGAGGDGGFGGGSGGMGGFAHTFLVEVHGVARAHAAALGGNALINFSVERAAFSESVKNQGYSLVTVSGDAVELVGTEGAAGRNAQAWQPAPLITKLLSHS
ncbi:hypothetical protein HK405_004056 [Cladochytrium tenue]|nr:hypothetical protein HK405_004056 [Cladochytrium tenue]